MRTRWLLLLGILALAGRVVGASPQADQLFKAQHWAEARAAYDAAREQEKDWHSPVMRQAVEGAVTCSIQLVKWDDAIQRAEDYLAHTQDSREEVGARRLLATLYATAQHSGDYHGEVFVRAESRQGGDRSREDEDRQDAVRHLERARLVAAQFVTQPPPPGAEVESWRQALEAEHIGVDFDLASVLIGKKTGDHDVKWWTDTDPPEVVDHRDAEIASDGDDEDTRSFDPYRAFNEAPTGVPLQPDGKPRFVPTPPEYTPVLSPSEKIRFLLTEVERLDTSAHRDDAARALLRRAMIARQLYGPETAAKWLNWWEQDRGYHTPKPSRPPLPETKVWQLGDDQAMTPVGSRLEVLDLPAEESPLALLGAAVTRYPQSEVVFQAMHARALYFQSREQFPRALDEYRALLARNPQKRLADFARWRIDVIEWHDVKLNPTGTQLAGERPRIGFAARNAETVAFTARQFDLLRYVEEPLPKEKKPRLFGEFGDAMFRDKAWQKHVAKEPAAAWSETLPPGQDHRAVEGATQIPLSAPGAYIVEARVEGNDEPARTFVLITDMMLVRKEVLQDNKVFALILACDARTGQPLANRAVRVYEGGSDDGKDFLERVTLVTDANGAVRYHKKHERSTLEAVLAGEGGRLAFSAFGHLLDFWSDWNQTTTDDVERRTCFVVTDRPLYRPGATVHFSLWLREKRRGVYAAPPPRAVKVEIHTPGRQESVTLQTDALGTAAGEWKLDAKPPLGDYWIGLPEENERSWEIGGGSFRVEEYRQPEFEVNVRPAAAQARLGEVFKATIEARYYFGAPVTQATVTYKVYRSTFEAPYFEPGAYDWLYGKGYGLAFYAYPWLPWWSVWGGRIGWGGDHPSQPGGFYADSPGWDARELVGQGEAELGPDGRYELTVDTARAKAEHGGQDHQYTIEASVRGASRRVVEGQGSVVATRQEFFAYVETDHGWYAPRNETRVQIRALTPGNVPVAVRGEVVVSRVRYGGLHHDEITEEEEKRWEAETGPDGRLAFTYPLLGEGQYHVSFRARDSWQQEVQGNAVFWVCGPQFDGRVFRFNELEIIADRRDYRVGDTAHLLVNTAEDGARLLFADRTESDMLTDYRFVNVPGRSTVIDVPIGEGSEPNRWVEATLVRNGRVRTEACELIVPPERRLLGVQVRTDKATYRPGEKGSVHVEVRDQAGKPARGQVTLTAFDKALTYIQTEADTRPGEFFHGQRNSHGTSVESSFEQEFGAQDHFTLPEDVSVEYGEPLMDWEGWWRIGAGQGGTPFWKLIRELDENSHQPTERIVVTGSNIPTATEEGPPKVGANAADGMLAGGGNTAAARAGRASADGGALARSPREAPRGLAGGGGAENVEPEIRTRFADTALWLPALTLDDQGAADAEITFPESLTAWRVHGYAINAETQVGDGTAEAATTKKLLVRLLSPRFFTERDEATLSAAVNNYLPDAQEVTAELIVPAAQFQPTGEGADARGETDADGNLHLTARASVAPNTEHRFDWRVRALRPGLATVTVRALTAQESDGMRLAFPVAVHGIDKTLAQSGSLRTGPDETRTLRLDVPEEIDPENTRLEITLSPSLAGVMIDALPYLADYPYGCVEQTVSRFYPSVIVRDVLKRLNVDLEAVGNQRRQMNPADLTNRFGDSPVYDSARLDRMVREGLRSLYNSQRDDGGWGWWSRDDAESSPFQTAYVLQGLQAARMAGVEVDGTVYNDGRDYLRKTIDAELGKPRRKQQLGDAQTQAYLAYALTLEPSADDKGRVRKWLDRLYAGRGELNNYGRALLALALHQAGRDPQAQTTLRNVLQFVERDDSNETAWVRTPEQGWWFWWNNDIETNAWALKALAVLDPKNDLAPRLVKWLLNNRRGGSYWRSTRDTAQVVSAMVDYLLASGERTPDYTLSVSIDGQTAREVRVTGENMFTFDNRVRLEGLQLKPGAHEVVIRRQGAGAAYYACQLTYFSREEPIKGAGDEIAVERSYARLVPKVTTRPGRAEQHAGFTRALLRDGDELVSGDLLEVTLTIRAKNTYDYLAFEDHKPAGYETVAVRSGQRYADGFCANVELRDDRTVFFVSLLEQGEHTLRYRLRAETPGKFHALPTTGAAMYAPEIRANGDEMRLRVRD